MDKLTAIRIKYNDGTYSDQIPVGVQAGNVIWDSTHSLTDILGNVDFSNKGNIQQQINQLFVEKFDLDQLTNYVDTQLSEDVTNWLEENITETGSAIIVDASLSIQGAAADAKATGDAITNVNGRLNQQGKEIYEDGASKAVASTTNNYKMNSAGANIGDSNFVVEKYAVVEGTLLHITAQKDSDGVWCYRTGLAFADTIVGSVNTIGGSDYSVVPTGATYLFMSRLKTTDTNSVKAVIGIRSAVEELDEGQKQLSGIVGIIPTPTMEKGGLNMTDGNPAPTVSAYHEAMRARTPVASPIHLSAGDKIEIAVGYTGYFCYNAGSGIIKEGWVTSYTVPEDSDVWFIVRPNPEGEEEVALETLLNAVTITTSSTTSIAYRMALLEGNAVSRVPDYYVDHMTEKVAEINENSRFISGVCFPFITDIHFLANSKNSKYLLKDILDKTSCDYVIAGGDYGNGQTAEVNRGIIADFFDYYSYIGHDKFYALVGNHDFTGAEASTWGEVYNAICRSSERYKTNVTNEGSFCIDIPAQKTRFICINSTPPQYPVSANVMNGSTSYFGATQLRWIADRLTELSGYNIIFISHIATDSEMYAYVTTFAPLQTMLEKFANKQSGEASGVTFDFTNTTNKLVCHISGHAHRDESHYSNGVLSIATTCDAHYSDDGHGTVIGTVTEQAFDVYCIDFDAETITAVRVGRGASRKWSFDGTVLSDATD